MGMEELYDEPNVSALRYGPEGVYVPVDPEFATLVDANARRLGAVLDLLSGAGSMGVEMQGVKNARERKKWKRTLRRGREARERKNIAQRYPQEYVVGT